MFRQEVAERDETNLLDRALLKAQHSRLNGTISAVEYHKVNAKVNSLKKLAFTEDYEKLQDRETYEFMKYKVAAEVGGVDEKEAFKLYEKTYIAEKGEQNYKLFAQRAADDPILQVYYTA